MATMKNHFTKCWQRVKNTAETVTSTAEYSYLSPHHGVWHKHSENNCKPHLFPPLSNPERGDTPTRTTSLLQGILCSGTPDCASFLLLQRNKLLIAEICKGLTLGFCLLLVIKYPNSGCPGFVCLFVCFTDPGSLSVQPTLIFPLGWGKASCRQ